MIRIQVNSVMFAYDMYHITKAFCPGAEIIQSVDEDYLNEVYNGEFKDKITVKDNSILTVIMK